MSKGALKELLRANVDTFESMIEIVPQFERVRILKILKEQEEILEKLQ